MKKLATLAVLATVLSSSALASELSTSFPKGSGSKFQLNTGGTSAELTISVADVSGKRLSVEYYITSQASFIPINFWQQYVMEIRGTSPALVEGYVFARELKDPEKLTPEYLKGFDGVQMSDFLFQDKAALDKNRIGEETVTVPAGTVKSTHYRRSNKGQTVDFWISDEAKPIGLVKLVSKGEKKDHQYDLELLSTVTNVARKIDPAKAKPLSKEGKALLATPGAN